MLENLIENVDYEWVELPSKGECYPPKKSKVPVGYLKAIDENIIVSSKHILSHTVCDELLRRKILDKDFNPDALCVGDRNAVLVWLRRTGYGDIIKNVITDEDYDLSNLTFKDFKLKGDEKGYFNYLLDNGDVLRFRLLTHCDEQSIIEQSSEFLDDDDNSFENLCELILLKSTVSINGNESTSACHEYLKSLSEDEKLKYMRFITSNTPDFDNNGMVMTIDDSLFINI